MHIVTYNYSKKIFEEFYKLKKNTMMLYEFILLNYKILHFLQKCD